MTTDLAEAVALLMGARDFGQFSDDMLDHPSPDVRSPVKSVREALRLVIDSPEFQALAQGREIGAQAEPQVPLTDEQIAEFGALCVMNRRSKKTAREPLAEYREELARGKQEG